MNKVLDIQVGDKLIDSDTTDYLIFDMDYIFFNEKWFLNKINGGDTNPSGIYSGVKREDIDRDTFFVECILNNGNIVVSTIPKGGKYKDIKVYEIINVSFDLKPVDGRLTIDYKYRRIQNINKLLDI